MIEVVVKRKDTPQRVLVVVVVVLVVVVASSAGAHGSGRNGCGSSG